MDGAISELTARAIAIAATIGLPILLVCLVVGLVISIFETATQIHEQSMAFVPKLVAVVALLVIAGSWMVSMLSSYTREVFTAISSL